MLKTILTLTAFGATALGLSAQPALKLLTADMNKLLEGYYRTEQEMGKLKATEQKAQEELEHMLKEGNQAADQFKETQEQSKSTLLTAEARSKAEADAAKQYEDLQKRQNDINNFKGNTQRMLSQQLNSIRGVLIEEIVKKVSEVGKAKGATIVMDRNAGIVYADTGYDITEECLAAINKDRPATPAPAAAAPAAPASPSAASETPSVTVPGLKK
jgi:Skp family chaperone for outer membrane proteins